MFGGGFISAFRFNISSFGGYRVVSVLPSRIRTCTHCSSVTIEPACFFFVITISLILWAFDRVFGRAGFEWTRQRMQRFLRGQFHPPPHSHLHIAPRPRSPPWLFRKQPVILR